MADYKERDDFPEVPDYKVTIGDNLDGGLLSTSDIYSPKSEPALIDNVLDPSEDILKEIVVLIDEFGKKTLKKSFTKEFRAGNSVGSTDGTNASALRGTGVAKQSPAQAKAVGQHHKAIAGVRLADDGDPKENKGGRVEKIAPLLAGVLAGSVLGSDDGEPKKSKSEFGMCSKGHSHKDQEDFDLCAKAEATSRPTEFKMPPPGIATARRGAIFSTLPPLFSLGSPSSARRTPAMAL